LEDHGAEGKYWEWIEGAARRGHAADRLIGTVRKHLGADVANLRDEELKGLVLDTFAECFHEDGGFLGAEGLNEFEANVSALCQKLGHMIDAAERRYQRDSMQKCVRLAVNNFHKSHHRGASRADMERCLNRLEGECSGFTQEARQARENISQMREFLMAEVAGPRHSVEMATWLERLRLFQQCPWKKAGSGKS
jgi:hypothetical protein